jgi:hypothetical protein
MNTSPRALSVEGMHPLETQWVRVRSVDGATGGCTGLVMCGGEAKKTAPELL